MEKYLGKEVELVRTILDNDVQQDEVTKAKLIGLDKGHVYEMDGKIAINPPGRVVLPTLPEGPHIENHRSFGCSRTENAPTLLKRATSLRGSSGRRIM